MFPKLKIRRSTIIKENQILLSFADKETADYVRLVCRRKNTNLESYILDNFEWDDQPECIHEGKVTKTFCKDCDERSHCPDRKVK